MAVKKGARARGKYKSLQTIFDKVALHLIKQKAKAIKAGGSEDPLCAYRGDDGLKCAVGALIPDDKYRPYFEGSSLCYHTPNTALARAAGLRTDLQLKLAADLQTVHDECEPEEWTYLLAKTAKHWNLNTKALDRAVA